MNEVVGEWEEGMVGLDRGVMCGWDGKGLVEDIGVMEGS